MPSKKNYTQGYYYSAHYWKKRETKARLHEKCINHRVEHLVIINTTINNHTVHSSVLEVVHALKVIEKDLHYRGIYSVTDHDAYYLSTYSPSPWIRVLFEKRRYLIAKRAAIAAELKIHENELEVIGAAMVTVRPKATFLDVGKKLVDLLDDMWNAAKNIIPADVVESIGGYLIGSIGTVVHMREGYEGIKQFYKAYKNENINQRKTQLVSSALSSGVAGAGIGLSVALIFATAGIAVAGSVLFPVLIFAFLSTIYTLTLWKRSYILHQAKIKEAQAEREYTERQNTPEYRQAQTRLTILNAAIKELEQKRQALFIDGINTLLHKVERREALTDSQVKKLDSYNKIMKDLSQYQAEHANLTGMIEPTRQRYLEAYDVRLKAERDVAFGTIELFGSLLVLVGTVLGTAAIIGASIASFGIAPLAILISGVVIGFLCKYLETKDEKNNHKHTRGVRNWFKNKWKSITGDNETPNPEPEMAVAPSVPAAAPPATISISAAGQPPAASSSTATTIQSLAPARSADSSSGKSIRNAMLDEKYPAHTDHKTAEPERPRPIPIDLSITVNPVPLRLAANDIEIATPSANTPSVIKRCVGR